jgi:MFS family permease
VLVLREAWPLFVGIGLLMLGNGLQGTLLGVRATVEGFGATLIGAMTAMYYAGFLGGSTWTARIVPTVGHIRVFAALTSGASATILVQGLVVDPYIWGLMRFLTGVCLAGIFVVAESWLNEKADNKTRGQMMAIYMVVTYIGMAGGQILFSITNPIAVDPFIFISVLISLAAIPMLLTASKAPEFSNPSSVTMARLYRVSPLGVVGTFVTGVVSGALFGMGGVYAELSGFDNTGIAAFMLAIMAGSVLLQWPIGRLSDLIDRRTVITGTAIGATVTALAISLSAAIYWPVFLALVTLFGGLCLSLHPLTIAYTNDYLEPTELVGASSGLIVIMGLGMILGPLITGVLFQGLGPSSYFWFCAVGNGLIALFALYRSTQRQAIPNEEQGTFVPLATTPTAISVEAVEELHADGVERTPEDDDTAAVVKASTGDPSKVI